MQHNALIERAWSSISRFFDNCKKNIPGKKGYPTFKKHSRSVEYKVSGWKLDEDRKRITFTDKKGIGTLKLIVSRDLNYFQLVISMEKQRLQSQHTIQVKFVLNVVQ